MREGCVERYGRDEMTKIMRYRDMGKLKSVLRDGHVERDGN